MRLTDPSGKLQMPDSEANAIRLENKEEQAKQVAVAPAKLATPDLIGQGTPVKPPPAAAAGASAAAPPPVPAKAVAQPAVALADTPAIIVKQAPAPPAAAPAEAIEGHPSCNSPWRGDSTAAARGRLRRSCCACADAASRSQSSG
jgi:hypothetical protein